MNKSYFLGLFFLRVAKSQTVDTLVDVGGYQLYFNIIPGQGTPILFEAGGDNDATIWHSLTPQVAEITGAPVITYDRLGLGKSSRDSTQIGLENEIKGLEKALTQLGYSQKIMLVSHSLGGFYNTFYAARHSQEVPAIVYIDATHPCFFTAEHLNKMQASRNYRNMVEIVKRNPLPASIPVIDIVSEKTLFAGTPDADRWKACHRDFVAASPHRQELVAAETGHYVFLANRQLVINAIVTLYANQVMPAQKAAILERGYAQEQRAANEDRRSLVKYWHSEEDLNEWGYSLLQQQEDQKALKVFKLNVFLHPASANAYDSLGEVYLKIKNNALAIQNYQKSLELNPKNENARKALAKLLK